jgi:hypothetical protein
VDMENICSTNLMWEVKSIFLEYQVYVNNLAYSGATDDRCANFSASVEYRAQSVTPAPHHLCKRTTCHSRPHFDVPLFHFPFRGTPSRVRQILLGKLSGSSQLLRYFQKFLARLKTNLVTNFSFPP